MPELCRFYNILIKMLYNDDSQHHKPHFHVLYAEYEASVGIDGELLAGSLPVKQLKLVQAWAAIHEEELYAAWNNAVRGIPFGKIDPLRIREGVTMYIRDGIAYAGEPDTPIKVSGVRPMEDYKLWVRFNTGEAKIFDFTPLLESRAFAPLKDIATFRNVYIDFGVTCWNEGDIDIAPEYLYENGIVTQ